MEGQLNAAEAIQEAIDAQQDYDALVYGLRSVKVARGEAYCCGAHAGQLARAKQVAARLLGRETANGVDAYWIRHAKGVAQERLKAAKEAKRAIGTARQLRLALAA